MKIHWICETSHFVKNFLHLIQVCVRFLVKRTNARNCRYKLIFWLIFIFCESRVKRKTLNDLLFLIFQRNVENLFDGSCASWVSNNVTSKICFNHPTSLSFSYTLENTTTEILLNITLCKLKDAFVTLFTTFCSYSTRSNSTR